jgi:hypothetical protein
MSIMLILLNCLGLDIRRLSMLLSAHGSGFQSPFLGVEVVYTDVPIPRSMCRFLFG